MFQSTSEYCVKTSMWVRNLTHACMTSLVRILTILYASGLFDECDLTLKDYWKVLRYLTVTVFLQTDDCFAFDDKQYNWVLKAKLKNILSERGTWIYEENEEGRNFSKAFVSVSHLQPSATDPATTGTACSQKVGPTSFDSLTMPAGDIALFWGIILAKSHCYEISAQLH